jgi:hypothetical protein
MNDDLISRSSIAAEVKNLSSSPLNEWDTLGVLELIYRQPSVDPHKHGRWIMRGGKLHCSNCDSLAPLKRGWEDGCTTYEYTASRWCPSCGAMMDGGVEQ